MTITNKIDNRSGSKELAKREDDLAIIAILSLCITWANPAVIARCGLMASTESIRIRPIVPPLRWFCSIRQKSSAPSLLAGGNNDWEPQYKY